MKVEQYKIFELVLDTAENITLKFSNGKEVFTVQGFKFSKTQYAVRFMPNSVGVWEYESLDKSITGSFECVEKNANNHGLVQATNGYFHYLDGETYVPVGTTCYAWIYQSQELITETLETLKNSPYNKIRMLVFPKSMPYNFEEPQMFPFEKGADGRWDVNSPNFEFWNHLDKCIESLDDLGIEADLILFHPYDRWGFSSMTEKGNLAYIEYCVNRLSAFKNIWWSLANEYELSVHKTQKDWDLFGEKIAELDVYSHLLSIHNWYTLYPKRDWMTHCSVQRRDVKKVALWRTQFNLPVIVDEYGYEGDIPFDWGNLSAFEMVNKAWMTVVSGGFYSHGETFHRDDQVLWWSKGGKLHGKSTERLAYLKKIQYEIGSVEASTWHKLNINPNEAIEAGKEYMEVFRNLVLGLPEHDRNEFLFEEFPVFASNGKYTIHYFGHHCPLFLEQKLPTDKRHTVELIDVWDMTRKTVLEDASGEIKIPLPAKVGTAVLISVN